MVTEQRPANSGRDQVPISMNKVVWNTATATVYVLSLVLLHRVTELRDYGKDHGACRALSLYYWPKVC